MRVRGTRERGMHLPGQRDIIGEMALPSIAKQEARLGIRDPRIPSPDIVVDMAVGDKEIGPAVQVVVQKEGSKAEIGLGGVADSGARRHIQKKPGGIAAVEGQLFARKVGDQDIQNVRGSIGDLKGSLLLGQSFLEKFKSWSMDNASHELVLE